MQLERDYKRIVVKIGSSFLTDDNGNIDEKRFFCIANQISALIKKGISVIVVSSGAIASAMALLKEKSRPKDIFALQAMASLGQPHLIELYNKYLAKFGLRCGQVLLTWDDFNDRSRYLNAKHTILKLIELGFIPVINENDTISNQEIRFGDNDRLSSLVAILVEADLLVVLSDVDGLYDGEKKVIPFVDKIDQKIESLAKGTNKARSVGGMISKIQAAKMCVNSGISCFIANGRTEDILLKIAKDEAVGTLFSGCRKIASKKHWLAFSAKSKGKLIVDDGAVQALKRHKSLLSVGLVDCFGKFTKGDVVDIEDLKGEAFAKGKVNFDCDYLAKNKRKKISQEVVHCDNLVLL